MQQETNNLDKWERKDKGVFRTLRNFRKARPIQKAYLVRYYLENKIAKEEITLYIKEHIWHKTLAKYFGQAVEMLKEPKKIPLYGVKQPFSEHEMDYGSTEPATSFKHVMRYNTREKHNISYQEIRLMLDYASDKQKQNLVNSFLFNIGMFEKFLENPMLILKD